MVGDRARRLSRAAGRMVVVSAPGTSGLKPMMALFVSGWVGEREKRSSGRTRCCWPFVLLALLAIARADSAPLSVDVTPMTLRPRSLAPTYIDVKFHSQ